MSKAKADELAAFVDTHPATAVLELLDLISARGRSTGSIDKDVFCAYLQRVAECEGLPEPLRAIADQLYREGAVESVSASAAAVLSLSALLH